MSVIGKFPDDYREVCDSKGKTLYFVAPDGTKHYDGLPEAKPDTMVMGPAEYAEIIRVATKRDPYLRAKLFYSAGLRGSALREACQPGTMHLGPTRTELTLGRKF